MLILNMITETVAVLVTLVFMVYYNRFRWEQYPEGFNAMILALGVFLVSAASLFREVYFYDRLTQSMQAADYPIWAVGLETVGWAVLIAALLWRIHRIYTLHKQGE